MTRVGTAYFASPQVLLEGKYSAKADIYSIGVSLYQLLFKGAVPFTGNSLKELGENKKNMLKF